MSRSSPRPAGELRRLVIDAATELFADRGYARTSTREITRRAGVTPYQLFAQFGTKAKLFEVATVEPYCALVSDYVLRWRSLPPLQRSEEDLCREIISGLFEVFGSSRKPMATLVMAHAHEHGLDAHISPCLSLVDQVMGPLEQLVEAETAGRGYHTGDPALVTRLTHGAVLAAILFRPWLGSAGRSRQDEITAMTELMLHGLLQAPGAGRNGAPRPDPAPIGLLATGPPARQRILNAATELFEQRGFPGTSTKRIAESAGSAETVLFSHFPTKADLFEHAITGRWTRAANAYLDSADPDLAVALRQLYQLLRRNRLCVLALLEVELQDSERANASDAYGEPLRLILDLLDSRVASIRPGDAPAGATHLALCTILGAAVLDSWVFTGRPSEERLIAPELSEFLLHGITHRGTRPG